MSSAPPLIHVALPPSSPSSRTAPLLHRSPAFQSCYRPGRCFLSLKMVVAQVKEAKGTQLKTGQVVPSLRSASLVTSSVLPEILAGHSPTFQNVSSEEELLAGIKREVEEKRIPYQAGCGMEELYYNYRNAVIKNEVFYNQEKVVQIMATVLDRILLQFEEPFTFSPYHKAIRQPYDYYVFGQNYIRPLIDFRNSYLGNAHLFDRITNQLKQGHNVILFSNHQTEADPAAMTLLLESTHASLAESLIFIAGDRVVLDPFCKPFSMGRNLLCVHSKKHINDIPELIDMKRKSNIRSLKELGLLLRKGGQLIWIAPSGGRDRPDPITGQWLPATFDISSVDNMRRLTEQARVPAHLYPLALLCYDIMPPPLEVRKEIGEKRYLGFSGVGMSISEEINFPECAATAYNPEEARKVFSQAIWDQVKENYTVLVNAVYGGKGLAASTSFVALSQPWIKSSTT